MTLQAFQTILHYEHIHNTTQFTTTSTMTQQAFPTILHYEDITQNQLFTLSFITLCFIISINQCGQVNPSPNFITPKHIPYGNTHISYT